MSVLALFIFLVFAIERYRLLQKLGQLISKLVFLIIVGWCKLLCYPVPSGFILDRNGVWKMLRDQNSKD